MSITLTDTTYLAPVACQFNQKKFSDCKIVFEKSNTALHLHKVLICAQSLFFETCFGSGMIEDAQSTVKIADNEDERLLTSLFRAMYTGSLTIEDPTDILALFLLAKKYEITLWVTQLETHLKNNSKDIFEQKAYLSLDEAQFATLIDLLIDSTNTYEGLQALTTWIEHDEEERAGFCFALQKEIHKAVIHNKPRIVCFDPNYCGSKLTLSNGNRQVQKNNVNDRDSAVLGTKCTRYKIRLINNCTHLMIGFNTRSINLENYNFETSGYYMYSESGGLYSQAGENMTYYVQCNSNGTVVEAILENNTIRFVVNGTVLPVAYTNVTGDLYPAFDLYNSGCTFEFI